MVVKARVLHGRLIVDQPIDLPDGTELELVVIEDELSDDEKNRLHAALDRSEEDARAGRIVPGASVISRLKRSIA